MRVLGSFLIVATLGSCLFLSGCYGCNARQNPDQVREKTAEATAAIKQNARAMAEGVREGWSRDHPLDLNSASSKQLTSLPGISDEAAAKIISNRPYDSPQELVQKRVLTRPEYNRIAELITVKK
jgi:competence protein ComEA